MVVLPEQKLIAVFQVADPHQYLLLLLAPKSTSTCTLLLGHQHLPGNDVLHDVSIAGPDGGEGPSSNGSNGGSSIMFLLVCGKRQQPWSIHLTFRRRAYLKKRKEKRERHGCCKPRELCLIRSSEGPPGVGCQAEVACSARCDDGIHLGWVVEEK